MKKWLNTIILLSLLELQVAGVFGDHSLVPGLGLLILCVYQAFSFNTGSFGAKVPQAGLTRNEKIFAAIYTLALVIGISMSWPIGFRYGYLLSLTLLFMLAVFVARRAFGGRIAARCGLNKAALTDNGVHAASILIIYIISFHIGAQIWFSLAFQPVIIISCLLAYALDNGKVPWFKAKEESRPVASGLHDKYILDMVKYWNSFMGVWCVMLMKDNGFFTEGQEHLILFTFIIMLFLIYIGANHAYKAQELLWIAFFAAFLTGLDPLSDEIFRLRIPSFIQAFFIIVGFDLGGHYFRRQMDATTAETVSGMALPLRHGKRAQVYLIAAIFIFGVNQMADDPAFDLENILKKEGGTVYSSVLGGGNAGGGNEVVQGAQPAAGGKITVDDPETSFHKAGT